MVKKVEQLLELSDVEDFMGIPAEDFVSEDAKNIHPSYRKWDILRVVVKSAYVLQCKQEKGKKPIKKFDYSSDKINPRFPNTTPPQQLWLKTERLLQQTRDNTRGFKRPLQFHDDDDYVQEEEEQENNRSKKKSKRTNGGVGGNTRGSVLGSDSGSEQPVALPPEVEKLIQQSGADDEPVLVIRKELENSDLNGHENRMSVPARKVMGRFLRDEEEDKLNSRKPNNSKEFIEVPIIMPSKTRGVIKLRKWDMAKNNGTTSTSYMLTGDWKKLIKHEQVTAKTEVHLWAYRVNRELHFALVDPGKPNPKPNGGGSSSKMLSTSTHSSR